MRSRFLLAHVLVAVSISVALAEDAPIQTLRGVVVPAELDVPKTWEVVRNKTVIGARGDALQILLSSDAYVGKTDSAVKVACDGAKELMPGATCTDAHPITLAGHEWMEFTVTGAVGKDAATFLNYTYSGPEGTFTIIGQIRSSELASKRDTLVRYMKTFRFPKAAPNSPAK